MELNPADAGRLGVREGGRLRVRSRRGTIEVNARITYRTPEGTVFLPFHFKEAAANLLTNPALDPEARIPEFKVCAVALEAAG